MRAEIMVRGIVQGVGFRPFIYRAALENSLVGYIRNRGDAGVEILVEGNESQIKNLVAGLRENSPPLAQIYDISVSYTQNRGEFARFSIVESFEGGDLSGSIIPYDVSICDKCLRELRDPENRRHNYFFTTCTECGPRYTTIERLPYDRRNTTMLDFPMCEECSKEYTNPLDRRFHAQTIACEKCGPHVFLTDNLGKYIEVGDPIEETGKLIESGYIVAIKGNGGFHVATSSTNPEPIMRLRDVKHRAQKPFAIMARDLESVKSFAEVDEFEENLIISNTRPIVLLKKSKNHYLSEQISPGLHNIGVMLPYTGLHYMLFSDVDEPAFVMTSANAPSDPLVIDNQEASKKLANVVDFILFHDRDIAHRCDDSLVRVHGDGKKIIRRSRGYAPSPIHLTNPREHSTLGVGAEENVNSCILLGDKAFVSQYVGDVEKLETFEFLEDATRHLLRITKAEITTIACDSHPRFITTQLAQKLRGEYGCPVLPVQHHYAHALSLMGEKGLDEIIGIVCDGAGYGSDGNTWGGEILHCTSRDFSRLGHLEEQPMVGGDLAARHPLRMVAGILSKVMDVSEWTLSKAEYFPYGEKEANILLKQIERGQTPMTTSCGRILDAISALLGICYERSYEGEPAMKLESAALHGEDVLRLEARINKGIIDTTHLTQAIFNNRNSYPIADLAYSAEEYVANCLAESALDEADRIGLRDIGFSGGVAYNEHISSSIRRIIEANKLRFISHDQVPPGDGGISFGQAVAASNP